jgi:hypothetical protein
MSVAGGHTEHVDTAPQRLTLRTRLDAFMTPSGLLLAAAVVLSMFAVTSLVRDPDFWWHLRAGQLIVAHGGLLGTDPFTYTASTHHWTMHEWLFEVVISLLFGAAGLGVIILVLSAVTWIGVLCVMARAQLRRPNRFMLAIGLLLAVVAGYPIWGPRVQMVTFCFSAVTLLVIERHLRAGGRAIWWLVPMFLLWSNLHSGFVFGLGLIALVIIAELLGGFLRMPDPAPAGRLRPMALVLLACTVVSMINPNGPGILLYAAGTLSSPAQQALIAEWHSPDFHDWAVVAYGVMLVTLLVMTALNRRMRARDAAVVLATVALSLQSVRNIALFVAAAAPVWIDQASMLLQRRRPGTTRRRAQPSFRFRALTFGTLIVVLFAGYVGGRLLPMMAVTPANLLYAETYPVCAARWLESAPSGLKIFNQYGEGGYLSYTLSAHGDRVFIFGDAALMGDPLLYEYGDVEGVQPNWETILDSSGTNLVLFDTGTPLANVMLKSPRWTMVYQDPLSIAFEPTSELGTLVLPPKPVYPASDVCSQLTTADVSAAAQQ